MSPSSSDDLTEIMTMEDSNFVVLLSPESASHHPDYQVVATLKTVGEVAAYLSGDR